MNEVEIIQHPQISGLSLFFDTVDYRTPHVHQEWELIWILEGALSLRCGQAQAVAGPGELLLFNPDQPHEFHKVEQSCTFLCLQASPHSFPALDRRRVERARPGESLTEAEIVWVKQTLLSVMEVYLQRPACFELLCMGQTCLLFHRLLSRMPCHVMTAAEAAEVERRNTRLARLLAFVDENYMHKIRLSDFAEQEGRSMSYLSHFVKQTLNQSFQEYVNTVRFNCACKRIASGHQKMLDVCMESGFSDYRYFSRTFRQRLNMTPEEYSRQTTTPAQNTAKVHHSLHSLERFYTREQSLELLKKYAALI